MSGHETHHTATADASTTMDTPLVAASYQDHDHAPARKFMGHPDPATDAALIAPSYPPPPYNTTIDQPKLESQTCLGPDRVLKRVLLSVFVVVWSIGLLLWLVGFAYMLLGWHH